MSNQCKKSTSGVFEQIFPKLAIVDSENAQNTLVMKQLSLYQVYNRAAKNSIKIKFWIHVCIRLKNLGFSKPVTNINASSE